MNIEQSLMTKAYRHIKNGDFKEALYYYKKIKIENNELKDLLSENINFCKSRINNEDSTETSDLIHCKNCDFSTLLDSHLSVEQTYVTYHINEQDKLLFTLKELNRVGLNALPICAHTNENIKQAHEMYNKFTCRSQSVHSLSSQYISKEERLRWKKEISLENFIHLKAMQKIFEDALQCGYERILVLNGSIFFHHSALQRIKELGDKIPSNIRVLHLGISDFTERKENRCSAELPILHCKYQQGYGYTKSSFATIYDKSIFDEILSYIKEYDGTFENAALGTIYFKHPEKCFIADPQICFSVLPQKSMFDLIPTTHHYNKQIKASEIESNFSISLFIDSAECDFSDYNFDSLIPINIYQKKLKYLDLIDKEVKTNTTTSFRRPPATKLSIDWPNEMKCTTHTLFSVCVEILQLYRINALVKGNIKGIAYKIETDSF